MKPLHVLTWAGCCLVLLGATGCKSSDKPRVAFITNNDASFWTIAEAGAKKAADDIGV